MTELCKISMISNGILVEVPPEGEEGVLTHYSFQTNGTDKHNINEALELIWELAELCCVSDKVRITKARKRKG